MNRKALRSGLLLLLAAFIWGVAFVAQSVGMEYMGPCTFNGARFLLGSLVLVPVILVRRKRAYGAGNALADETAPDRETGQKKTPWIGGICCGIALGSAALFQQYGIQYTSVGKAGFITTLYIILVPFLGIFIGKKVTGRAWMGAVIAAAGMYLLCMTESLRLSTGDLLVFICAVIFSVHILVVDHFAQDADGVELSCIQFLVAGIIGTVGAFLFEQPTLSALLAGVLPIAYAGILSSGVGYTLQIIGQKDMDPTAASLILSMESVFSAIAGFFLLHQTLTGKELIGCALVFAAVIFVQLPDQKKDKIST